MYRQAWYVSISLILAGVLFAAQSWTVPLLYGPRTHWGYLIAGLGCITCGTALAALVYRRETGSVLPATAGQSVLTPTPRGARTEKLEAEPAPR